jgi:hypothetical protein
MSKTNSATWTTESKSNKLRGTHSFKLRHESKSTNDVRSFGSDVKAKHQMLVHTKAECVGELTAFLPTLTATADSLAQGIDLQHSEVNCFVFYFLNFFFFFFFVNGLFFFSFSAGPVAAIDRGGVAIG